MRTKPATTHPSERRRRKPTNDLDKVVKAYARRFPNGTLLHQHESAYRTGRHVAMLLLELVVREQEHQLRWSPDKGQSPTISFARGIVDVLLPGLKDTRRLLTTKAGQRFKAQLRDALADDLAYSAEDALELARAYNGPARIAAEDWEEEE